MGSSFFCTKAAAARRVQLDTLLTVIMFASHAITHALRAIQRKTSVTHAFLHRDCLTLRLMVSATKNVLKARFRTRQLSLAILASTLVPLVLTKENV